MGKKESELEWEHVKGRLLQEEQRINMRNKAAVEKSESQALVSQSESNTGNCKTVPALKLVRNVITAEKWSQCHSKCWKEVSNILDLLRRTQAENKPAQLRIKK